uniref:Hox9 N-terminal activation domain-containing protein n=1 Tax=Chinchilla lanigera TaxID=34839 RepID=A0A8C2YTH8_CHILA
MSISGTLSSYYVDSIISHESEDAPPAKFPSGQFAGPRQPGAAEHLDFPSCSFQPKAPVFGASWAPLSAHASGSLPPVYHPYLQPQGAPAAEGSQPLCQLAACPLLPEKALSLHQIPDAGAREGVSVQYVPHQGPQAR